MTRLRTIGDRMPARRSTVLLGLAALAVAWSLLSTGGSPTGIVSLLPVLLLLTPLLLRRYPGEQRIARLRESRSSAVRPARPLDVAAPATTWVTPVRGGLLLGRRLAVRPPPGLPAHA